MRLIEYFDATYIINLPRRADRRRETEAEFNAVGLTMDPARVQFFPAHRPDGAAGFPTIGAHGCFLSHLGVLEQARERRLEHVLILEDDVAFLPAMRQHEAELLEALTARHWDLAYPGHFVDLDAARNGMADGTWVAWNEQIVCSHCYAVHSRAIGPLIDYLKQVQARPPGHPDGGPMHYDGALNMFRARHAELVTLLANPSLAAQRASRTDIHDLRWFDRWPVVRELAGMARRIKHRGQGR